jgi:hypothetical protein
MARGWESKGVESQVEAKEILAENLSRGQKLAEEQRRESERRGLNLSRTRILNELDNATNPHHRKSLEAALAHLDQKLAELN